jgi:hypothetical protein
MDVSRPIEVYQSLWRTALLAVLGFAMTALAAALLLVPMPPGFEAEFVAIAGWIGLVFFGACTLLILWRGFTVRGPVLVLSPSGWHDSRVSASAVPWTAVQDIKTWSFQGQRIIVVTVDPETESRIGLTVLVRWSRGANAAVGADGLCVNSSGLTMGHDALLALFLRFRDAAGDRGHQVGHTR